MFFTYNAFLFHNFTNAVISPPGVLKEILDGFNEIDLQSFPSCVRIS